MMAAGSAIGQEGEATATDGLPSPRRHLAILALMVGTVVTSVDASIVNVALPTLARELHIAASASVTIVTAYQLVLMMTLLPFAALGDRIGHRRLYQGGQMIFCAATLCYFFAHSLPQLVAIRAVQAVGAAAVMSVSAAMVRSIYPAATLGRALALNTVVAASSSSVAPSLGGALLGVVHWPWVFAMGLPFAAVSLVVGHRTLPQTRGSHGRYDVLGALLCAATLGMAVGGLETIVHADVPLVSAALIAGAGGVGTLFVRRARWQERPILPLDLLRQRTVALPVLGLMLGYLASMLLLVTMPFRLQQYFHFSPAGSGAMMAPWAMTALVVAPLAGALSDRVSASLLGAVGLAMAAAGAASLALVPPAPDHFAIIWRITLCAAGFCMFYSPNFRQIISSAPRARVAAAGGLTTTVRGMGQTLGSTTVAALLASGLGTGPVPPLLAAGICVAGIACCLLAGRR